MNPVPCIVSMIYSSFQVGCPKIATRIRACAKFSIQNSHQKGAHARILVARFLDNQPENCCIIKKKGNYPARACAARGKVMSIKKKKKSTVFLEPIFYLSKYSLSELYFNTDRLLIEFNGLWYSLAARQVFVAIANPDSLSFG